MIHKLRPEEFEKAARLYHKGIHMQIPPGRATLDAVKRKLQQVHCIVNTNGKMNGLLSWTEQNKIIEMEFIVSLKKGVGTKLVKNLAKQALKKGIKEIKTTVSSKDQRVQKFYHSINFRKYSKSKKERGLKLHNLKATPKQILS